MDKKKLYAFLITATIIATTMIGTAATPFNPLTSTTSKDSTSPTRESAPAPPVTAWNKTYGGIGGDVAQSVDQTSDGGYIVLGQTSSFGAGMADFWLVKTSGSGSLQWNNTYGGASDEYAYSVQQTSDHGYIMAGSTDSFGAGGTDFWLVKTDSSGNKQWNKTYGGANNDQAYSVQQTSDGGYVIAGTTYSYGAGGGDMWLVKTDSTGNHQWNKTYGKANPDYAYSVQQTSDHGYIVAGGTHSYGDGSGDFWLVKADSSGNQQWNESYGGSNIEYAWSVQQTSDSGYIAAGYTASFGAGGGDMWLVKTDSSGNHQWNKTYGGNKYDESYSVLQTSDDGYILAGTTYSYGAVQGDMWLVKTDSSGNHQWNKTYGGTEYDIASSVQRTSDGEYILAGATMSFGEGSGDFWLVKTGDGIPPSAANDLAAGNPTETSITLTWTAPGDDGKIGNATGYVVKYSTIGHITAANWSTATTYTQSWTPSKNGTTETRIVTGLTPGTKYWFAVQAYDDVQNYGTISNSPSATTASQSGGTGEGIPMIIILGGVAVVATVAVISIVIIKMRKPK